MAITKVKLKQLENSATAGSIATTDSSNILTYAAPSAGVNHLWGYETGGDGTRFMLIGTNLSYDTATNTLNASAGAGGYSDVQEDGAGFTNSNTNTKLNFVGTGLTAADAGSGITSITLNSFLNTLATAGTVGLASGNVSGTLPVGSGGTGATTLTGLLRGNGTGAFTAIGTSSTVGQVLRVTGTDTYAWGAVDLADTDAVTGILDEVNGGTGQSSITTGDILYGSASNTLSKLAIGAASTYLKGGTTPTWATLNIAALSDGGTIATQTFVTDLIAGIRKGSVRVASTGNGTLATAFANGQTVDTVTLVTGDLILLKNQTNQAENGAYTVNASGAPTRATWMNTAAEIDGVYVAVEDGSQAGTLWITVSDVTTLGTDNIVFTQVQTSGTIGGSITDNQIAFGAATANTIEGVATFILDGTKMGLGTASPNASSRVHIKGTASTNSTYGLIITDNADAERFRVGDGGTVTINNASNPLTLASGSISFSGGTNNTITSAVSGANGFELLNSSGGIKLSAASSSTTTSTPFVTITSGTAGVLNSTSNAQGIANIVGTFSPSGAGSNTFKTLSITPTINQTTHTGITYGIHILPTLTAAADFRGLEITATGHYAIKTTAGKVQFDLGSDAQGDLLVRGSGGELTRLAAGATAGHVLTSNGSGAAPTYQAPSGGTKTVGYVTGANTDTYTLNNGTTVLDVDGAGFVFTVPSNLDLVDVYLNGVMLSRSGTVGRDYTLNSGTNILTLAASITTSDYIKIVKRV